MADDRPTWPRSVEALDKLHGRREAIPTIVDDVPAVVRRAAAQLNRAIRVAVEKAGEALAAASGASERTGRALTPAARAMLDDSIAALVGLTAPDQDPGPRPEYTLTVTDDGRVRLALDVTFDPAGLNAFAAALAPRG